MQRHLLIGLASALISGVVLILALANVASPFRAVLTFVFFLVCPGLPFVTLLGLKQPLMQFTYVAALSLSTNALIAIGMINFQLWLPVLGLVISVILTLVGAGLHLIMALMEKRAARKSLPPGVSTPQIVDKVAGARS